MKEKSLLLQQCVEYLLNSIDKKLTSADKKILISVISLLLVAYLGSGVVAPVIAKECSKILSTQNSEELRNNYLPGIFVPGETSTATLTPSPTSTPSPSLTSLPTPTFTATATFSPQPTSTPKYTQTPTSTVTPTLEPTPTDVGEAQGFEIRGVSTMKISKDRVRNQLPYETIFQHLEQAAALGANMIAIETPYDNPQGGDSIAYTYEFIKATRELGMNVLHRHMFLQAEGIYDEPKVLRVFGDDLSPELKAKAQNITSVPFERLDQYLVQIYDYIISHPDMFAAGDMFAPSPEPDSRGVVGIGDCSKGDCLFTSIEDFNQWLVDSDAIAEEALAKIGFDKTQIHVGQNGLSGFTVAGLNNPDWEAQTFLSCEAIDSMDGVVAVDHYTDSSKMKADLEIAANTLENTCPEEFEALAIGEYGDPDPAQIREALKVFQELGIATVNYWVLEYGDTGLIDEDNNKTDRFSAVQEFYSPQK